MLRFHTQTGGSTLTAQQPENNVVRVTVQAMAAVLGGTQSLHTNSMDEALGLPTEKAARIALRTQQIVAEESGVANTVDPFAGSYYVEWLTDRLEAQASAYIERIEQMGGMLKAIERGFVQKEIADAAYRAQKAIEAKGQVVARAGRAPEGSRPSHDDRLVERAVVVGVNEFTQGNATDGVEVLKVDPAIERAQVERLRAFKARRDAREVERRLAEVRRAARGSENLMPLLVEAVQAGATVGEVCRALRDAWGEYQPPADA
jgi:methylmalonyl-CoA mutase N-terminal domain/subunit